MAIMANAVRDYKFGTKNHWRRWAWNRISERLNVPAREAIVFYLAGEQDLDRAEALRRGFNPNNLFAVERDGRVTQHLREKKILTLNGDFFECLWSWPPDRQIHVVIGDFCSGLTEKMINSILLTALIPHTASAIFVFNFLRGRDHSGNEFRKQWNDAQKIQTKHRGLMIATEFVAYVFADAEHLIEGKFPADIRLLEPSSRLEYEKLFQKCKKGMMEIMRPIEFSYRSDSNQTFDSIIFVHPFRKAIENNKNHFFERIKFFKQLFASTPARKQIAAVLAHRTMRLSDKKKVSA